MVEENENTGINRVIHSLRKPEVRSSYTQILLDGFHEYFDSTIASNSSDTIQGFKKNKGIIFPAGSVLRGTARVGSDFDTILLYDSSDMDSSIGNNIANIVEESEKFHPSQMPFNVWITKKIKETPQLSHFYDERLELLKKEITMSNKYRQDKGMALRNYDKEKETIRMLSGVEGIAYNLNDFTSGMEKLSRLSPTEFDTFSKTRDCSLLKLVDRTVTYEEFVNNLSIVIPQLLTVSDDFVINTNGGDLLHHQKKIVQALSLLEETNPYIFKAIYQNLKANFEAAVLHIGQEHNHATTFDSLVSDYVEQSGKFPGEKTTRAISLLKIVRKRVKFPDFKDFKQRYL